MDGRPIGPTTISRHLATRESNAPLGFNRFLGALAEWLRSGLQSRLHQFDSGRRLSLWRAVCRLLGRFAGVGAAQPKGHFDLYGHLMPGDESEAAALFDVFLGAG